MNRRELIKGAGALAVASTVPAHSSAIEEGAAMVIEAARGVDHAVVLMQIKPSWIYVDGDWPAIQFAGHRVIELGTEPIEPA